ncbi:hypothetical protein MRB53_036523 [Persea americana]|nr:hypothetical protein MRB53_037217 [Persea americana]KAJ8613844.1 hypothetical protein MRB53_036801 [Persea americana]KAJ8614657.1 hypothetical protein MRB53_036523 [Persea americana]
MESIPLVCLAWIIEADLPWDGFPKVLMTLPGSSALSVGKILFTAKVGNRSEARERINSFDLKKHPSVFRIAKQHRMTPTRKEARNSSYFLFSKAGA